FGLFATCVGGVEGLGTQPVLALELEDLFLESMNVGEDLLQRHDSAPSTELYTSAAGPPPEEPCLSRRATSGAPHAALRSQAIRRSVSPAPPGSHRPVPAPPGRTLPGRARAPRAS